MVAELADTIGVRMCVEGVEYDEQLQILKDMKKVQYIQGYYYDKPLTEEAFEKKYLQNGWGALHLRCNVPNIFDEDRNASIFICDKFDAVATSVLFHGDFDLYTGIGRETLLFIAL